MSEVKRLADEEADRVEAELAAGDDETAEPEPEPEPEPAPDAVAAGPSDADLRKFESENTRHERALAKIVGDDWQAFEACGVCGGVGHVPAALNVDVPFKRDPQTEPCEACDGYGTTLTGAREPGMVTRACSRCQGSGWTTVQEYPDTPTFVATPTEAPATNGETVPAPESGDPVVAELRARGYIVVEPPVVAPVAGS